MPRRRPKELRADLSKQVRSPLTIAAEPDQLRLRIYRSSPTVLRGVHVEVEVNGVPLLNGFDDGLSHVVGTHPESFFAPDSAVLPRGDMREPLTVGDPIGCHPECCGVGAMVWQQGERVHWRLLGDRWNRRLQSSDLEFDREEYRFMVEWARDAWKDQLQID